MSFKPGDRLGPYDVVSLIGAGGMGEVYRCNDARLGRAVALKVLRSELAANEDLCRRFRQEGHAAATLQHSNICSVFDVGEHEGAAYLVMEYLQGETLETRLKRKPLSESEALDIAIQVAAALDAAHSQGITHRDLKPANIMLTKTGVKLLDFGLARLASNKGPALDDTLTRTLTTNGAILGTVPYMAPEQLEGADVDARTDLFAFGLVCYEMFGGRRAFEATSAAGLISAVMTADPQPLSSLNPQVSPLLDSVIRRCLSKKPEERWQSARDLSRVLELVPSGGATVPATAPMVRVERWRQGIPWILAAVAGVAALFLVWRGSRETPVSFPPARFSLALPPKLALRTGPFLSPDGTKALMWLTSNEQRLYMYTLSTGEFRPVGEANWPFTLWSPEGRSIGFYAGAELRRMDLASGAMSLLATETSSGRAIGHGAWNRSQVILYTPNGDLVRVNSDGSDRQVLAERGKEKGGYFNPQFLPDGEHFIVSFSGLTRELRGGSLRGGGLRTIAKDHLSARFAPPGYLLLVRDSTLVAQPFDPRRLALLGSPQPLVAGVKANVWVQPAVSDNGVLMFSPATGPALRQLTWLDRSGRNLGAVGGAGEYSGPALAPDGGRLAVAIGNPAARNRDIWVIDLVRGAQSRLTSDPADDFNPVWSSDGKYVAFTSDRKGKRNIYRKLATGVGEDELLIESGIDKVLLDWSPDRGSMLLSQADERRDQELMIFSLVRKLQTRVGPPIPSGSEQQATFSPDGRYVAYRSDESNRWEIYVEPLPATGQRWQVSTAGGVQPEWGSNGAELFFLANDRTVMAADVRRAGDSLQIGIPHALFEAKMPSIERSRFVVSRDGKRFLVVTPEEERLDGINVVLNWQALLNRQ